MIAGMQQFLMTAAAHATKVDLHTMSGADFKNVLVTAIDNGAIELLRVVNNRERLFVLDMARIEWAVASLPPTKRSVSERERKS